MLWAVCCWWCMWQVFLCAPFLSLKPANRAWILMTHRHSYLLGLVILLRLAFVPPVAYTLRPFWDEPLESLDALHFVFRPQLILHLFPRGWFLKLSCPFGLSQPSDYDDGLLMVHARDLSFSWWHAEFLCAACGWIFVDESMAWVQATQSVSFTCIARCDATVVFSLDPTIPSNRCNRSLRRWWCRRW